MILTNVLATIFLHTQTRGTMSPSRGRLPETTLASAFKEPIESRCQIGSASIRILMNKANNYEKLASIKAPFGRALASPKTAPALASLVERLV